MAHRANFERLPVEIMEQCIQGLPAQSLAILLGLSRQTRALVLTSIEFMFSKNLKSIEQSKQYLGLEAHHTSLSVTLRSHLTFTNFVPLTTIATLSKQPLRYARFELQTPMDLSKVDKQAPMLFTCSNFRKTGDIPGQNYFEDLVIPHQQDPIMVDRDGLLLNLSPAGDSDVKLTTLDINPFKVLAIELASKRLAHVSSQGCI